MTKSFIFPQGAYITMMVSPDTEDSVKYLSISMTKYAHISYEGMWESHELIMPSLACLFTFQA